MLPRLEHPTYPIKTPVGGLEFRIRPYTNREEKVLLLLKESTTEGGIVDAMCQIVESCSFDLPVRAWSLPLADLIWTFIKIRSYSVGEVSELNYRCIKVVDDGSIAKTEPIKCNTPIHYELNLNDIEIRNNDVLQDIDLGSGVKMRLRHYTGNDIIRDPEDQNTDAQTLYEMVICIYTDAESNDKADIPFEEFEDWYNDIPLNKKVEIERFLAQMPSLYKEITLKCPKCGNESKLVLETVADFFQ